MNKLWKWNLIEVESDSLMFAGEKPVKAKRELGEKQSV